MDTTIFRRRSVCFLLFVVLLLPACAVAADNSIIGSLASLFYALAEFFNQLSIGYKCFFNPSSCIDPTTHPSCIPTTGQCVSTAEQLQAVLDQADSSAAVVSICAASTITTYQAITVRDKDDITICCEENDATQCILQSSSINEGILDIVADRVSLRHLTFRNGRGEFGGNVALEGGNSNHVISGCDFRNGKAAGLGGNLYVRTEGTLTLDQCTLTNGISNSVGGGMYVSNARAITITNSRFESNQAAKEGGGFIAMLESVESINYSQKITIDSTVFVGNAAEVGGGLFVTRLGRLPTLNILNSEFSFNGAAKAGGAGAIAESLDGINFSVTGGRSERANEAPVCTDFLARFSNTTQPYCVSASGGFSSVER